MANGGDSLRVKQRTISGGALNEAALPAGSRGARPPGALGVAAGRRRSGASARARPR